MIASATAPVAELLLPAIRWSDETRFEHEHEPIERALALGVGGFIFFGGPQEEVRALVKSLRQRARMPLLYAADLERGAGQQFAGATGLPPLAAIASLDDEDALRRAAKLTAREARTIGINWDYAPVCDLDVVPENPIVGTRALGGDPAKVARQATAWIQSCQLEGVLACAKHFPGHGRTRTDSHAELPVVDAPRQLLLDTDVVPFKAAIAAGVASIMTAHVAFPALDPGNAPATLSREILQWLLRQQLGFDGLIVTDALIMQGVLGGRSESEVCVQALRAGCDLLLYPTDAPAVAKAIDQAVAARQLDRERLHQSLRRRLKFAQWASPPNEYRKPSQSDIAWGAQLADRVVHAARGTPHPLRGAADVLIVDDDLGGPYPPPPRSWFLDGLRAAGVETRVVEQAGGASGATLVIALFGDVRAWKKRAGYSEASRATVAAAVREAAAARDVVVVQFSHPRLASEIPDAPTVLCAWGGERAMQEAAARRLAQGAAPRPQSGRG